jgi:hypothetical protein
MYSLIPNQFCLSIINPAHPPPLNLCTFLLDSEQNRSADQTEVGFLVSWSRKALHGRRASEVAPRAMLPIG